jgi:hypothetical protein
MEEQYGVKTSASIALRIHKVVTGNLTGGEKGLAGFEKHASSFLKC